MYKTRYLVDTDVIINYLKGKAKSKDFIMKIINGKAIGFFSVITEAELLSGARDRKDEVIIYDVLDIMDAIEVDRDTAVTAGKLRRKYAVYSVKLPDALIAATALKNELIVATANEKHFTVFDERKENIKDA